MGMAAHTSGCVWVCLTGAWQRCGHWDAVHWIGYSALMPCAALDRIIVMLPTSKVRSDHPCMSDALSKPHIALGTLAAR